MKCIQVTLTAGQLTQFSNNSFGTSQIIVQNNSANACRVGDGSTSATVGLYLAAGLGGGSINWTAPSSLGYWYGYAAQTTVLDVMYQ